MEKTADSADKTIVMPGAAEIGDLFRRMPVALYRTDVEGRLLTANMALASLLGFESVNEALSGIDSVYSVYVDPDARSRWLEVIATDGLVFDFDVELRRTDGSTLWVQDIARAIETDDGNVMYYEGALIDVTEKVEAKKARDEFLATVSHELRNPIAVVLGLSRELADRYDSFGDDERRDIAEMIARQSEDASWLIEDLLVAYRDDVDEVAISTQDFGLVDSVERVLEVTEHDIPFDVVGEEPRVRADPRRTRQIIRNLVDNAVNYGGNEVVVRCSRMGDGVEVSVCDSGESIDDEDIETIFTPFRRGKGPNHPTSVGLGLPVARKLARLMGGNLTYRYTDGYSCFVLTLPAA